MTTDPGADVDAEPVEENRDPELAGSPVRVTERLVRRDCEACGEPIEYAGRGRRPRFCSNACRQHAWALRAAEARREAGSTPRPQVVREVVERTTERPVKVLQPREPARPHTAREWVELLEELTAQLADERHQVRREHWHHRRLFAALDRAVETLNEATPGGLDRL